MTRAPAAMSGVPRASGAGRAAGPARAVKRAMDVVAAGSLLVLLSPLLVGIAAWIAADDGTPVLFRQRRVGRDGEEYELLKFRSMRLHSTPAELVGQVREDHELVTPVGRFIRRWKIDELPQLVNVLRGEMSLVGPRPTIPAHAREYDDFRRRRLRVRPGMTGWAQVNGNTQVSWDERIEMDVWYVDHWSLALDLRILLATATVVARGERPDPEALKLAKAYADRTRRRG